MRISLSLAFFACSSWGAVSLVNTGSASNSGSQTSVSVSYSATTGNALFVSCESYLSGLTSLLITDAANTYTLDKFQDTGTTSGNEHVSLSHSFNITGGTRNITCTANTTVSFGLIIRVAEFSGVPGPVDGTITSTGNTTTGSVSSGSTTTTNAEDLIIGVVAASGGTASPGSGFTQIGSTIAVSAGMLAMEYKVVAATGSYASTWTISSSRWGSIVAGYTGTAPSTKIRHQSSSQ